MMEKEINELKICIARIETKQDIIIERMPDKGSILERLKIHTWLIGIIILAILGLSFNILKDKLI